MQGVNLMRLEMYQQLVMRLANNLLEWHHEELTESHYGDSEQQGESPDSCSYCGDLAVAREALKGTKYELPAPEVF